MRKVFAALMLIYLSVAQTFLPKEGPLPMCDIFSRDIARAAGENDFYKVDKENWSTIISYYPVRPDSLTRVTFYLVYGNDFTFGCGKADLGSLRDYFPRKTTTSVSYATWIGKKYSNGDDVDYGPAAVAGDKISMTIDLRPFKKTVSFAKNGVSMGVAFGGLHFFGDEIYIMAAIKRVGHRFRITEYVVEQ